MADALLLVKLNAIAPPIYASKAYTRLVANSTASVVFGLGEGSLVILAKLLISCCRSSPSYKRFQEPFDPR